MCILFSNEMFTARKKQYITFLFIMVPEEKSKIIKLSDINTTFLN